MQTSLFVDGRCALRGRLSGPEGAIDASFDWTVGGALNPDGTHGLGGFIGQIQQAQASKFTVRSGDGVN